jgi:fructokinase
MKPPKIVGIGELLWDELPKGRRIGGAPLNFAYYASQTGADAAVISAIGSDASGDDLAAGIAGLGVDVSPVQRNGHPTGHVGVELQGNGVPAYNIFENVAWDFISEEPAAFELVRDASAVCWGSLAQRNPVSRKSILAFVDAAPKDALRVFDINLRQHYFSRAVIEDSLRRADILKLNEDELPVVCDMFSIDKESETRFQELLSRFALKYVIYTQGADGSEVHGTCSKSFIPTPKVHVADTVGAGDSFTAAFVSSLLRGRSVERCHRNAVDISAFVCTQDGAIAGLPENLLNL